MPAAKVAYIWDTKTNHVSVDMPRHPPRLSVALMWAKPGQYSLWQTELDQEIAGDDGEAKLVDLDSNFDADLPRLLKHIQQRLMKGLDEAWVSRFGYGAPLVPYLEALSKPDYQSKMTKALEMAFALGAVMNEPQEQWARAFTEMTVFAPYGGIGLMNRNNDDDDVVYAQWPKFFSVWVACQHISTYGALSRGFTPADVGKGFTAGPNAGATLFPDVGTADKRPGWITTDFDFDKFPVEPGDVAGANENERQIGFAHIASCLRRWPLGKLAREAKENAGLSANYQWIDTGVVTGGGDGSTADHGWNRDSFSNFFGKAPAARRGFGRLSEATKLEAAVEEAKKAKPIGFARLMLVEASGRARYVSAMLPMWHDGTPFPIARYLWSIRDLPAKNGLKAYWAIYTLRGGGIFEEITKDPDRSCEAMVKSASSTPQFWLGVVCTSEPRVVRITIKSSTSAMKNVQPNAAGKEASYDTPDDKYDDTKAAPGASSVESYDDYATKKAAYDAAVAKAATPADAAKIPAPQLPGTRNFFSKAPLKIEADAKTKRLQNWQFLEQVSFLSTELLRSDPSSKTMTQRPMAESGVPYFNGGK